MEGTTPMLIYFIGAAALVGVASVCVTLLNRALAPGRVQRWLVPLYCLVGLLLTWPVWHGPSADAVEASIMYGRILSGPLKLAIAFIPGILYGMAIFSQHALESLFFPKREALAAVVLFRASLGTAFLCGAYVLYCIAMMTMTSYYRGDYSEAFIGLFPYGIVASIVVGLVNSLSYSWFSEKFERADKV